MFKSHYNEWRKARIDKIIDVVGTDFFNGASVLELGCGFGQIGKRFQELGANVTLADGREEHVEHMKKLYEDTIEVICLDQEYEWNLNRQFDMVVHMGVLYHLENWERDLRCALAHTSSTMVLETVVTAKELKIVQESSGYDQALHGKGSRVPATLIEPILEEIGKFKRYDDRSLDTHPHLYSWNETNIKLRNDEEWRREDGAWLRRLWTITREKTI